MVRLWQSAQNQSIFLCDFNGFKDKINTRFMIGKQVTMLRIASVFTPASPTLATPKPPLPPARKPPVPKPMVPPVTPSPALHQLPPEMAAAQSEAAFAVAATRNAPPPIALGELSLPADPLPDLPALGIAAPDSDAIAAQKARADASRNLPPTDPTSRPQNAALSAQPAPAMHPAAFTPQPFAQASLADRRATS